MSQPVAIVTGSTSGIGKQPQGCLMKRGITWSSIRYAPLNPVTRLRWS